MEFVLVQGDTKEDFEKAVNTHLTNDFVFAGNIVYSDDKWAMPMIKFSEDKNMENRLAKQLWGMFIARLF